MLKNFFKIVFRNIKRHKTYSFINITGLSMGLTVFILAFLYIQHELSYDKFNRNADNIYRIVFEQHFPNQIIHSAVSPSPAGPTLKEELPEITNFSRYTIFFGEVLLAHNEKAFYESDGAYADPGFFEIFSIPFVKGNPKTALNKSNSVVLTENFAVKYFGEENPIGKTLKLENFYDLQVTGIIEDTPENFHLQFDFVVPFILLEQWGTNLEDWNNWAHQYTYVLLQEKVNLHYIDQKIANVLKKYTPSKEDKLYLQPLTEIHLFSDLSYDNYADRNDSSIIYTYAFIAFIVLFIACINFINLSTARSIKRSREIGLKKVVGANRLQLIIQFWGESLIFVSISFIIAIILIEFFLPIFNNISGKNLSINYFNNILIINFFSIMIFTAIIAGIYPAFFLSSVRPINALKGTFSLSSSEFGNRKSRFRKALVIIQFSLSIVLIIASLTIHHQLNYLLTKKLGFDKENIIFAQIRGEVRRDYEILKEKLLLNSNILEMTAGSSWSTININTTEDANWEGKNTDETQVLYSSSVDFDFLSTFNIKLKQGRDFSKDFSTDTQNAFIINEKAVELMGFDSPVGQHLSFLDETGQIIGVIKDYHFLSLNEKIEPLIMSIRTEWRNYVFIKIKSENISHTIEYIKNIWNNLAPDIPFEFTFLDDALNEQYFYVKQMRTIFFYFTCLAILISCLGLYGMVSFVAEQKTKEIGIRKVLGASILNVIGMLSNNFTLGLISANVIAWPIAYFGMNKWLQNFAYKTELEWWVFLLAGSIALLIAIITVSSQAIKAAIANPIESIRYE
jgi:ABC-type antimicrobial peptide transport system permease subunit